MEVQVKVLIPIVVVLALLLVAVVIILCYFYIRPYLTNNCQQNNIKYRKLDPKQHDNGQAKIVKPASPSLIVSKINQQSSKISDFSLPHISNTYSEVSPNLQDKEKRHFDFVLPSNSRQERSFTEIHSDQGGFITPDDVFHYNETHSRTGTSSSSGSIVGYQCIDLPLSLSHNDLFNDRLQKDDHVNNNRQYKGSLTNDYKTKFRSEPVLTFHDEKESHYFKGSPEHKRRRFSSKLGKSKKRAVSLMSPTDGQIEFTLFYDQSNKSLTINLLQLSEINLKPECFIGILEVFDKDKKSRTQSSVHLVRNTDNTINLSDLSDTVFLLYLSLLPKRNFTRHTSIVFGTQSAVFNEKITIPDNLLQENQPNISLCIHAICKFGRDGEPIVLGEVKVPLKRLQNSQLLPFIANLTAPSEELVLESYLKAATDLGYLEIYLSFNPIAQSLVVKVIQASDLPKMGMTGQPNISVKTSLYYCNCKIDKKTTSIQKRQRSPIFNETFEFQLSKDRISECDVLFEIRHHGPMYRSVIGYVIVGNSAGGEGTEQWRQLLDFTYHEKLYKIMPKKPVGLT